MDNSFTLGGRDFKLSKLDAMKQFHIARRMGPVLAQAFPAIAATLKKQGVETGKDASKLSADIQLDIVAEFAAPVVAGFSSLSDKDSEYVLYNLLSVVEVKQQTGNWAKISNGEMLMIESFERPTLFNIAGRSFMFNLGGFLEGLPRK